MSRGAKVWVYAAILAIAGSELAGAAERFVAWGDSITLGYKDEANLGGYPGRLQTMLIGEGRPAVVENRGLFGETTGEALSRINGLSGGAGDTFILMEGSNDLQQDISKKTVGVNLGKLLDRALANGFGNVMLSTIIPMSSKVANQFAPGQGRKLDQDLRQLGYTRNIDRPDAERGFADLPNLYKSYYSDGKMHPNAAGYTELAKIYLNYIQRRDNQAPQASFHIPNDAQIVPPTQTLQLILFDPLAGVDFDKSTLTINSIPIATTITGDIHRAVMTAKPGNLCGTNLLLGGIATDLATPPNTREEIEVIFSIKGCAGRPGDVNYSGRVDGVDLVLLANAFGAKKGESRYLLAADINGNGVVDGTDLALLASHFGEGNV